MHQGRNPTTIIQILAQIQDLQNKRNSSSDATEFYDPDSGRSSGATHVPSQPSTIPSPRTMPRCDSGLPHDKGMLWVLHETFLKAYLLEKDERLLSSTTQRTWHPLVRN